MRSPVEYELCAAPVVKSAIPTPRNYPYKNGFAAYAWVATPEGDHKRKYVYGKTCEETHEKWIKLHSEASKGPVQTRHRTVRAFLSYWLESIVKPNLARLSYVSYEGSVRLYINPHLFETGELYVDHQIQRAGRQILHRETKTAACPADRGPEGGR